MYILLLALTFLSMKAPTPPDGRTRIKALMVYQFATQIDWPKQFKTGSFVIGVYGNNDLYEELKKNHSSKTVGSQPIKILNFATTSDIKKCHILYVDPSKSGSIKDLVKKYKSQSMLVVSEKDGGLKDGAVINFVAKNDRTKYELSKTNANTAKLIINSKIIGYAVNIE